VILPHGTIGAIITLGLSRSAGVTCFGFGALTGGFWVSIAVKSL
jgi:hypothetical protein